MSIYDSATRIRLLEEAEEGYEEGARCNRIEEYLPRCDGLLVFDPEDCSCMHPNGMPPCNSCVLRGMTCPACGWRQDD